MPPNDISKTKSLVISIALATYCGNCVDSLTFVSAIEIATCQEN